MREEILRLEKIIKNNNGIRILDNFHLNIFKGEILGLFSLNDLGKSNLLEIICGKSKIDSGIIYFDEVIIETDENNFLNKNSVFIVDNKSKLSNNLTVSDNIFVIRNNQKKYIIHDKRINKIANGLLEEFDIDIDPKKEINQLSLLERWLVELIKAYALGVKIIIIDDLSSHLSTLDMLQFNRIIKQLQDKGISFLYIDSDLDILFNMAERLVIMRDGKNIRTFEKDTFKEKNVLSILMGEEFNINHYKYINTSNKVILEFSKIYTDNLSDFSLSINTGNIVSLLDINGKSNEDIVALIMGNINNKSGFIKLDNKNYLPNNDLDAFDKGIVLMCENPIERMLFRDWSVLENLHYILFHKIKMLWLKPRIKKSILDEYYKKFGDSLLELNLENVDTAILYKLLYYRWHLLTPKILICIKPFTGLDVYLRNLVIELMHELARKNITIIVISSNITEAYILGNEIVLIDKNKIVGKYQKNEINISELNRHINII